MTKNIGEGDSEADMKPLKSNATTEPLDSETPAAILLRWTPDELDNRFQCQFTAAGAPMRWTQSS